MLNLTKFFRKIRHKQIISKLDLLKNLRVLDTSCQDGTFLERLLKKNQTLEVCGIDISEVDIEKAKKLIPKGDFKIANNKFIPFSDKTFDVVVSSMTLHHLEKPFEALSEIKRVLKDGDTFYLIDVIYTDKFPFNIIKYFKCREPYHFEKFYTVENIQELCKKSGFKIETQYQVSIFPFSQIFNPVRVFELK